MSNILRSTVTKVHNFTYIQYSKIKIHNMKSGIIREIANDGKSGTLKEDRTNASLKFYNPEITGVNLGDHYEFEDVIQETRGGEVRANIITKKIPT